MKDYSNYYPKYKEIIMKNGLNTFELQLREEGEDLLLDGVNIVGIVQEHSNPLDEIKEERRVMCSSNFNLMRGSHVETLKNARIFMVLSNVDDNSVYKTAKMLECNNTLPFQDETLQTIAIPCLLRDKTSIYSDGVTSGKYLTLADDQILITIPNNSQTIKLKGDKRFIFNHEYIYALTKVDALTQPGLLNLTMTKSQRKDSDRLDLNLADYIEPSSNPDTPTPNIGYSIAIEGSDSIMIGDSATYTTKVYGDGVIVDIDVSWSLDNTLATITSQNGTSCTVKANNNFNLGATRLKAILTSDSTVFSEKDIEIRSLF